MTSKAENNELSSGCGYRKAQSQSSWAYFSKSSLGGSSCNRLSSSTAGKLQIFEIMWQLGHGFRF